MKQFLSVLTGIIALLAVSSCGFGPPGPFVCELRCKDKFGVILAGEGFNTDGLDQNTVCEIDEIKGALTCLDCMDAIEARYRIRPSCDFCPLDSSCEELVVGIRE